MSQRLLAAFTSRFHGLLDASLNVSDKVDSSALKQKLTLRERLIFDAGRDASRQWQRWKTEKARSKIEQSSLVAHSRKGKRSRTEE